MPLENTPPAIDETFATNTETAMQTIIDSLEAFNINLTIADRKKVTSIGPQRTAFVVDYYGNKNDFPSLKPPFMNETEADAHRDVVSNLQNILTKAAKLQELVDDLKLNSEHFAYQYALEGYSTVVRGKEQNVPGADTFYGILSPYFEGQGGGGDDDAPTDPVPPTP